MCSIGPGLYRAIIAAISDILVGFNSLINFLIPADSSWNTPNVSPLDKSSKVLLSDFEIS